MLVISAYKHCTAPYFYPCSMALSKKLSVATLEAFFSKQTKRYVEAKESKTVIDGHKEKRSNRAVSSINRAVSIATQLFI